MSSKYTVSQHRDLGNLERGLQMFEIDSGGLIAGFVFLRDGVSDYRDILGHPVASGHWTAKIPERRRREALFAAFDAAVADFLNTVTLQFR